MIFFVKQKMQLRIIDILLIVFKNDAKQCIAFFIVHFNKRKLPQCSDRMKRAFFALQDFIHINAFFEKGW